MSTINQEDSIKEWISQNYRKNKEVAFILAIAYVKENNINWGSQSGRQKVIRHLKELLDENNTQPTIDNFFEIKKSDIESISDPKYLNQETDGNRSKDNIVSSPLPAETIEILKKVESEGYKSLIIHNLTHLGYIKQIRKAKIFAYLHRKKIL